MALTRVQEKTRELGGADTFVDEILSMLGTLNSFGSQLFSFLIPNGKVGI
jgi:hypothetical protein